MTLEAQRIAIMETCGRKHEESMMDYYLNDLNAMHKAENKLNNSTNSKIYGQWLVKITQDFDVIPCDNICLNYWALMSVARATTAQRAEAFLRTLNLWKDDV